MECLRREREVDGVGVAKVRAGEVYRVSLASLSGLTNKMPLSLCIDLAS